MEDRLITLKKTYQLLNEDENPSLGTLMNADGSNIVNKILKPTGIVIQDTFNNPIFKIPLPLIDTSKFDLPDIKQQYTSLYSKSKLDYLPWHYIIEMIQGKYYFFQTRPLDSRYPISSKEAEKIIKNKDININENIKKFFINKPFDLQDSIHICIIGDSNKDVYIEDVYYFIGKLVAGPILRYFKLNKSTKILNFNMGKHFKMQRLEGYLNK
jgi:hypothetical protein